MVFIKKNLLKESISAHFILPRLVLVCWSWCQNAILQLTQPSLTWAQAELGNNKSNQLAHSCQLFGAQWLHNAGIRITVSGDVCTSLCSLLPALCSTCSVARGGVPVISTHNAAYSQADSGAGFRLLLWDQGTMRGGGSLVSSVLVSLKIQVLLTFKLIPATCPMSIEVDTLSGCVIPPFLL